MYPVIFRIGGFELHTYGVMLALAFAVGIFLAVKRGKQYSFSFNQIYNISMIVVVSAIVGSRIAYVFLHLVEFQGRWWDTISPIQSDGQIGISGLVMLGGVIASAISVILYFRWKKLSTGKIADVLAPCLALGFAIGKAGCFFNGCCFGKECHLPWAMKFPPGSVAHYVYGDTPIHPTQLYAITGYLLIFIILITTEKYKKFHGFLFALFLILYGIFRFINEIFRYYEGSEAGMKLLRFPGFDITFSQIVSLIMLAAGLITIFIGNRRANINAET
ncbi:MAG: prolipoprotein diacylglyceryl transferase [candidate division Zixibacteria bacterium]|nr:prolipoprotein diacylglyceryl transferase [Candidatus Tariuqbacter arcticus]